MTHKIEPTYNPFSQEEVQALTQCIYQDAALVYKVNTKAIEQVSVLFNRSFTSCREKAYQLKAAMTIEFLNKESTTEIEVLDIDIMELLRSNKKGKVF